MAEVRNYARELDYVNAVACLLVVLIHVLSAGVSSLTPASWQAALVYIPWRLAAFAVPAFLFTGAVKMALAFDRPLTARGYRDYLWRRFRRVYLPYMAWHTAYYVIFMGIGYVRGSWRDYFGQLLAGSIASPFYYVILVMQFYALLPLWRCLVDRVPWYAAVLCAAPVTVLSVQLDPLVGKVWPGFAYADRLFTSYLIFWVAGLYAGRNWRRVRDAAAGGAGAGPAAVTVAAACALSYWQYAGGGTAFAMDAVKLCTDLLSVFLLLRLCTRLEGTRPRLESALGFVHRASLSVYLSHCLFLTLATYFMQLAGVARTGALLLGRALVCYTLPFLLYALWDRLRRGVLRR